MQKPVGPDPLAQAMAEPSRRAILESLRFGQKCVTELVQATGLKQPNVSNHLAKMRQQGIVRAERLGRHIYYSIALPIADAVLRLLEPDDGFPSKGIDNPTHIMGEHESAIASEQDPWQNAYFRNVIAGQEDHALALVNSLLSKRIRLETIYTNVFAPALVRVGEMYVQGLVGEAHEHLVSAITERMMTKVAQFYTPVARNMYRATLGCVAGNWHMLGLRMLADGLKMYGWETHFLGANVPTASFLIMVSSTHPDLVAISCGMEDQVEELRRLIARLAAFRNSTPELQFQITVGGHCLPTRSDLLQGLPIDFTAPDLPNFLSAIRERF